MASTGLEQTEVPPAPERSEEDTRFRKRYE